MCKKIECWHYSLCVKKEKKIENEKITKNIKNNRHSNRALIYGVINQSFLKTNKNILS